MQKGARRRKKEGREEESTLDDDDPPEYKRLNLFQLFGGKSLKAEGGRREEVFFLTAAPSRKGDFQKRRKPAEMGIFTFIVWR